MPDSSEELIWKGHPSHWTQLWFHAGCLVAMGALVALAFFTKPWVALGAIVPALLAGWRWLQVRCTAYEVTTERIKFSRGVLTKVMHELELYRARDTTLVEPFWFRMVGKGNVVLNTTDASTPVITLEAVPQPGELREKLRKAIEQCRTRRGVRVAEIEGDLSP